MTDPRNLLINTAQGALLAARDANNKAKQMAHEAKKSLEAAEAAYAAVCKIVQAGCVTPQFPDEMGK